MKNVTDAMTPEEAAAAFYGQDDATFAEAVKKIARNDPRLKAAFEKTRERYQKSQETPKES